MSESQTSNLDLTRVRRFITHNRESGRNETANVLLECVFEIERLREQVRTAPETTPQAPIAHVTVREYEGGYRYGWGMYAPGLPPGTHDLYCEPPAPGGQKVPHPCFEREPPHCSTCACGMPAPETDEGRQRLIDEARILFPHCGDPPNETGDVLAQIRALLDQPVNHRLIVEQIDALVNSRRAEKTNDGLPPFYTERKCSQCGATEERIQREGCPEKCGRTAGDVKGGQS